MSLRFRVFLGIDVSIGPKPVTFVALDEDQQPFAIGEGDLQDALAFAAGQNAGALAAVNATAHRNRGRMTRAEVREGLKPSPEKGRWTNLRQVEYELIQSGFTVTETSPRADQGLPWLRRGFRLADLLGTLDYRPFPDEEAPRQWLETHADAAFHSLLGVAPLHAGTLEGRIQRQLVLRDEDLKVPDAMDFFEEVTRFRLLKSILPDKDIFSQAEINAWMAAHTAWLAVMQPERVRVFGEPEEGTVFLPCRER